MRIATGTGDDGTTGLIGGRRVAKTAPRIECLGRLDEANALLGLALAHGPAPDVADLLTALQNRLFNLGAVLARPGHAGGPFADVDGPAVREIEAAIDGLEAGLPPLTAFILPGGTTAAAVVQVARTAVRTAERGLWGLEDGTPPGVPVWINRLSDLLFLVARRVNADAGTVEPTWRADHLGPGASGGDRSP